MGTSNSAMHLTIVFAKNLAATSITFQFLKLR